MHLAQKHREAREVQLLLFRSLISLRDSSQDSDGRLILSESKIDSICKLTKSWAIATEQVRIAAGIPLPGSKRPAIEVQARMVSSLAGAVRDHQIQSIEDVMSGVEGLEPED